MTTRLASIGDATDDHLECREVGHAWAWFTDPTLTTGANDEVIEFTRLSLCLRCGAERRQVIDVTTYTVRSSSIRYPDGYLTTGSRVSKPDVRREVLRRVVRSISTS